MIPRIGFLFIVAISFALACGPRRVKQESYEEQLATLERLSLNLDEADDNPLLRGAILSTIMFNSREIEICYQKASRKKPNLVGKIKTFFTIGHTGRMIDFKIKETTLHSPQVELCVERIFRTMNFPPTDKLIDVTHSIKFSKAEDVHSEPVIIPDSLSDL